MSDGPDVRITVKYSCAECGVRKRECRVPARDPKMIVTDWLEKIVIAEIARDHLSVSPNCEADEIQDLMIPHPKGSDYVWQPRKH